MYSPQVSTGTIRRIRNPRDDIVSVQPRPNRCGKLSYVLLPLHVRNMRAHSSQKHFTHFSALASVLLRAGMSLPVHSPLAGRQARFPGSIPLDQLVELPQAHLPCLPSVKHGLHVHGTTPKIRQLRAQKQRPVAHWNLHAQSHGLCQRIAGGTRLWLPQPTLCVLQRYASRCEHAGQYDFTNAIRDHQPSLGIARQQKLACLIVHVQGGHPFLCLPGCRGAPR